MSARLAFLLLALAFPAQAQRAQAPTPPVPSPWHFGWGGGLHFFGPVNASFAIGAGLKKESTAPEDNSHFLFAFVEPGVGGHRASLGYAESVGSFGGGWSMRSSLLRLSNTGEHRTYAGFELQAIPLLCLGTRLGAYRPLHRDGTRTSTLWIADVSLCL